MKAVEKTTVASVWDALADTPEQAANLKLRAQLMQEIAKVVKHSALKKDQAAERCGITETRLNDLLSGKVARFSLDALFNIGTRVGVGLQVTTPKSLKATSPTN
jgi:predicted XRE-type DNA-binding protein